MSFHLHLRAVPPAELRPGSPWTTAFMLAAWGNRREECAAGTAESIEKDFAGVHQLYTGAADGPADTGDPSGLPIFGGELVPHEDGPPFLILHPHRVAEAAAFLSAADFDSLWEAAGTALRATGDPEVDRDLYLSHHRGLAAFYRTAADTGHAVIKAFWY
ncbi:DUF1877 family protein [Kitasatospora sp. NPDC058965]|uniref:DUF1877 family protein n=1 Tax=Kitasatospora sp. NPDC058965 TaxID=3346682 RepID=UPI0036B703CC